MNNYEYKNYSNYKKTLGMELEQMRKSDWFKELDKEHQEYVLEEHKKISSPPTGLELAILNMAIGIDKMNRWLEVKREVYPFLGDNEPSYVNLTKRDFYKMECF